MSEGKFWNHEATGYKELLHGEIECEGYPDWDETTGKMVESNRSWLRLRMDVLWMWFVFHICGTDLLRHDWDHEEFGDAEYGPDLYSQCLRCYYEPEHTL